MNTGTGSLPARLFVLLACVYMLTSTGRLRTPDEYAVFFQAESLVTRHSLSIPQAAEAGVFYGKIDLQGRPRAPYLPAHALAVSPWYVAGRTAARVLPGVPPDAADTFVRFVVTLSAAFFAATACVLLSTTWARMGVDRHTNLLSTCAVAFATPVFAYSGWNYSEPLACALLAGTLLSLFGRRSGEAVPRWAALLAGALLGCACWIRPTHVVFAPLLCGGILLRDRTAGRVNAATFLVPVLASVGLLLAFNARTYGYPLDFGYPEYADGRRLNSFDGPPWRGLVGLLLSPGKSLFVFAPPVVLALTTLPRLWRASAGLGVVVAGALPVSILLFARFAQWEGGFCVGPRYLVPAIVLTCTGLPVFFRSVTPRERGLAMLLVAIGVAVQCLALATNYLEDQTSGRYYDSGWNYRMDYSLAGQIGLLAHYALTHDPVPLGFGFDRWTIFLVKAGVSAWTVTGLAASMIGGAVIGIAGVTRGGPGARRRQECATERESPRPTRASDRASIPRSATARDSP